MERDRIILDKGTCHGFIVPQTPGHFIRGPKINIHVFKNDDSDMISNYLDKELGKLHRENVLGLCDTAVLFNVPLGPGDTIDTVQILAEKQVEKYRCEGSAHTISLHPSSVTSSCEWPAVIAVHEFGRFWQMTSVIEPSLYLTLSRARVYCSVLLFPGFGSTLEDIEQLLSDDLKHYANIIRY